MQKDDTFERLVRDAWQADFSGWDFSYLYGRWTSQELPWDYRATVEARLGAAESLLDMGTGGGEFLSSLSPLPRRTCATEAWSPNVPVARKRLSPLGVELYHIEEEFPLPFADSNFDLVINRHESYDIYEVHRILRPGGVFITQQVGGANCIRLNELITGNTPDWQWSLKDELPAYTDAGFEVVQKGESFPDLSFHDIGAVVYYLKVIPWQIENFDIQKYREKLKVLHNMISRDGMLIIPEHRFIIEAIKPALSPNKDST